MVWLAMVGLVIGVAALMGIGIWQMKRTRPSAGALPVKPPSKQPKPREAPSATGSSCMLIFALGWTLFSAIFVIVPIGIGLMEWQKYSLLRDTGVPTEAKVVDCWISSDEDGDTYYLKYQYSAPLPQGDRSTFTGSQSVSRDTYEQYPLESSIVIHYSVSDPSVSAVGEASTNLPTMLHVLPCFSLFGMLFVAIGLAMLYEAGRSFRRGRALSSRGQITHATVTNLWTEKDSAGDTVYCTAFRFTPPGYSPVEQAEYVDRKFYEQLETSEMRVRVEYLAENPLICRLVRQFSTEVS